VRLFVAAELPEPVVSVLAAWRPVLEGVQAVAPQSLHLTLAFLGERSAAEASAAGAVVRAVAAPVDGLMLGAARWLPARRPRVLAVEVADPSGGLAALQAAVVAGLGEAIGFAPERRRFLAHVTVGRVRRGDMGRVGVRARGAPAAPSAGDVPAAPGVARPAAPSAGALPAAPGVAPFALTALTLMRSKLGGGRPARYEPVERVALSPFLR
jgi:2'-5' RNA ligase